MMKKRFLIRVTLMMLISLLLFGCSRTYPPDGERSTADPQSEEARRYLGSCIDNAEYGNTYTDSPDIPGPGAVKLTPLASYLANTAAKDEELYFLVGVTSSPEQSGASDDKTPFEDYIYNGKKVSEYLADFAYSKYIADTNSGMSPNAVLTAKLSQGMSPAEALSSAEYKEVAAMYFEYQKAKCEAYADYLCRGHSAGEIPASAHYLAGFCIELCCDPYTAEWQYHLQMIKLSYSSINAINGTMNYLVKCTAEELLKLTDENQDYGFIFYASESNGKFIVSNAPRDVNGVYQWFYPTDQLFFYDRTLTGSHMAYSYQEIGLYDRLTYIK
ncbi:MAG: hypothetical protein PUA74_02520 [Clostridiales bacterium]|nr:hypothetical protein [Clostridiales bacterium]